MNINEAARSLSNAYHRSPEGRKVAGLHLFGMRYSNEIQNMPIGELLKKAGITRSSYKTEIRKGIVLGEYANVKTDNLWF